MRPPFIVATNADVARTAVDNNADLEINMTRFLTAALIAAPLAVAGSFAQAGGLAEPIVAPAPVAVAPAPAPVSRGNDWTGFYAGGSLGYGDVDVDGLDGDFEGATFGAHVGYNYDLGSFVLGGELEAVGTNDFTSDEGGLELDNVLRAKVRAGYDGGSYLPYVTAGYVQATVDSDDGDLDDDGFFYGVGLDYAITDSILVGGEYLRHEFDDFDDVADVDVDTFSLRVSYKF